MQEAFACIFFFFNLQVKLKRINTLPRMECRLRNHPKESQRLLNRRLLVERAEEHLRIFGLGLVVAFALDDAVLAFDLRDVQGCDVQAGLRLDARLDFAIGGFALGLGDAELVRVDADLDDIIWTLLDQ